MLVDSPSPTLRLLVRREFVITQLVPGIDSTGRTIELVTVNLRLRETATPCETAIDRRADHVSSAS